jgi:hypothetical protein
MKAMSPEFRVSYPCVFKPKENNLNGKIEFSVQALFKKGQDLKVLQDAAKSAAEKKWGTDQKKWPKNLKMPFKDQANRAKEENGKTIMPMGYEAGAIYMDLKNEQKPGIVDRNNQDIIDPSEFYAGCYARATIHFRAYSQAGNNGVAAYLGNLQKLRDGDPLGNRMKAQDEFAPIGDSESDSASDIFGG